MVGSGLSYSRSLARPTENESGDADRLRGGALHVQSGKSDFEDGGGQEVDAGSGAYAAVINAVNA